MEQMLGDLAATSELDLLQVFKSFESGPALTDDAAGTGTEGNLLSLLVNDDGDDDEDVDMMMAQVSPPKCLPPLSNSSGCGGHITAVSSRAAAAEREAQDQQQDMAERKKMLAEMDHDLSQMQRRRDFLLRRLRKQQVHHMGRQLSEEVVGLFELSARAASVAVPVKVATPLDNSSRTYNQIKYLKSNVVVPSAGTGTAPAAASTAAAAAAQEAVDVLDVEELTPASIVMRTESPPCRTDLKGRGQTTAVGHHPFIKPPSPKSLRSFVQTVVVASSSTGRAHQQQKQHQSTSAASGFRSSSSFHKGPVRPGQGLLPFSSASTSTLDDGHRLQLTNNVGLLKTELRVVEQAIDSEATASSSGGESADELINYSNSVQESLAM